MTEYSLCIILFCVGLYAVLIKRNIIKVIIGIGIMEYAVNLFFILLGYKKASASASACQEMSVIGFIDPTIQAVILVSITLSLALTCLLVSIALRIYEKFNTYDIRELKKLKG